LEAQKHAVKLVAPFVLVVAPTGHEVHGVFPVMFLYFPMSQAVQVAPVLVYPMLHLQSEILLEFNWDVEFAGHDIQALSDPVITTFAICIDSEFEEEQEDATC
jgi:hypothetical protein